MKSEYTQVCVWPGTVVGNDIAEFESFMKDEFHTRVKYLEEIKTFADKDRRGNDVPDTGGRNDLFFSVHSDDIGNFAIPRMSAGIRWIEDAISEVNGGNTLYPERVTEYLTW
jgi:hypothetical protein